MNIVGILSELQHDVSVVIRNVSALAGSMLSLISHIDLYTFLAIFSIVVTCCIT